MNAPLSLPFAATAAVFESIIEAEPSAGLAARRRAAFARYLALGREPALPYRKPMWVSGERTMRTAPIVTPHEPSITNDGRPSDELATLALANAGGLVHFGGLSIRRSGAAALPPGVTILPLAAATTAHATALDSVFGRRIDRARGRNALLASAFMNCGAYIAIAPGVRLEEPLQLLWIYPTGQTHAVFPFIVISLGAGARATVYERHLGGGDAFVCGIVDVHAADGAALGYVVLQQASDGSQLRMQRFGVAERRASLGLQLADIGAANVRNTTTLCVQGARGSVRYAALSFRGAGERAEHRLRLDVRAPAARVESVCAFALTGAAAARHHEHISVRGRASRTDAASTCEALLLSRKAAAEFVPERSAAHDRISLRQRARIGSIDPEAMFYLASRGIDHATALKMLALGFFEPALLAFPSEIIRDEVRTALDEHIEAAIS